MAAERKPNDVLRSILILKLPDPNHLSLISAPIAAATTRTRTRLLITIFSPFFDRVSHTDSWDVVQRLLTHAYVQATSISQNDNRVLMSVDILLRGVKGPLEGIPTDNWDTIFYADGAEGVPVPQAWRSLPSIHLPSEPRRAMVTSSSFQGRQEGPSEYAVVALGGTFDHLHAGHKILLSMAAWITKDKIIVGVTDDVLLIKKVHKELLEPLCTRLDAVRDFLQLFKPGLVYDVVPITDVYGPTGWDPNIQALVVSKETLPGAASIDSLRAEKSLPPLKTFVIDVISASSANLDTDDPEMLKITKMSSTFIREWIHEQHMRKTASSSKETGGE